MSNPFLYIETVLFQTIQFSISTQFCMTLSGATTPGQSGLGSDCKKGILHIPQRFSFTGASLSDSLVTYLGRSLEKSYTPAI